MAIGFGFTEEQELYRRQIKRFAREVLIPNRQKWDQERKTPQPMVQQAVQLGLLDPEMDHVTRGIMVEEVGNADFNCALPFLVATEAHELMSLPGLPEEVSRPVRDAVLAGRSIIAVGFTEPGGGSNVADFKSRAELDGNQWRINAVKNSVSWADADYYIVTCRTEEGERNIWSLSNFFVPRDTEGVNAPRIWDDIGTHGGARGEVRFEDVRVPADHLIGERGKAYELMAELFDTNRAYIGLKCIGAAQASVDETCAYAKERVVMGKPISQYQGITFPLVEAETMLEAARLLCYKTLWMRDNGIRHTKEGAMCKWWVPEVTFEIVRKCLTIHGH
ncbi:MAG: acyl-CoA dehydrogenase family protein, partial [Alphaproteobacteria bacterium]|nr:acyl-CoA dehydrogenase family protein [Alphaproteobacteria bacterium]